LVLVGLLLALLAATSFLPHDGSADENGEWRAKMPFVPKELRRRFATAAAAILTAYTFAVLVLSLGGQVEHDLIGSSNALLNGAVLSPGRSGHHRFEHRDLRSCLGGTCGRRFALRSFVSSAGP
jgi:hypothetical protein